MSLEQNLKIANEIEKNLNKKIDDEVNLDNEIISVAEYVSGLLDKNPIVPFEIQNRHFVAIASTYFNNINRKCIQIVAREKTQIVSPRSKIIKANIEIDEEYSMTENLNCALKGLLGHIVGKLKPQALD